MSLAHTIALRSASYWSPFTRDLAILQNDQPRRRAVYIHIATSMLVSMALVLTVPWFTFARGSRWYLPAFIAACFTLASAAVAAGVTLSKTAGYRSPQEGAGAGDQTRLYPWFNRMAAAVVVVVLVSMLWICLHDPASWEDTSKERESVATPPSAERTQSSATKGWPICFRGLEQD